MKLYYVPGACSMAPHIALREAGLSFDMDKMDPATRRTGLGENCLQANPKGSVPALRAVQPVFQSQVADAYLFTVLNWCNLLKLDMGKWPALTDYLGRIAGRPAVQATLKAEGLVK